MGADPYREVFDPIRGNETRKGIEISPGQGLDQGQITQRQSPAVAGLTTRLGVRVPPPERLPKLYYFYILYAESLERYYTGISSGPEKRLHFHDISRKGWTRRGRPWKLVFTKSFPVKSAALRTERFVKAQKSVEFIQKVIYGEVTLD